MSTSDLTPTVVLVHGAFVDASSWNGVIAELKAAGSTSWRRRTCCEASALTPPTSPASSRRSAARPSWPAIYAGAVISQTGSDASNVAGLVYIAAYAPEAGETLGAINARYPDVPLAAALRTFTYTNERGEQATDTFVDPASFHDAVCAEAPADVADTLARTQRPASLAAFATAITGMLAWKTCVLGDHPPPITPSTRTPSATWPSGQAARSPRSCLARGPGHTSRGGGRGHRPRGQGHQMNALAAEPFGPLQRIDAGVLNVGYVDAGPSDGQPCCCSTAGPTTSTATPTSRRCWPRPATA